MSIRIVTRSIWQNPGNKGERVRRTLAALRWQLHKRIRKTAKTIQLKSGCLFRVYPDCVISSALQYATWPEYAELIFCRERFQRGQILIDVGANVGHVPLLLGDLVNPPDVFAFEPAPVAFQRLEENWRVNGWPTTQLFECAIGNVHGTIFMADTLSPVSTNSVHAIQTDGDIAVAVRPLDSFRHLWADHAIGLLKIDVESYEPKVFAGSNSVLQTDRPRLIMFESLDRMLHPEIAMFLDEADYFPFQLDPQGRPDFATLTSQNLFAMPRELRGTL